MTLETPLLTTEELEFQSALTPKEKYNALEFEHPLEMLVFFKKEILEGHVVLYPWQIEVSEFLGGKFDFANPLRFILCAANGSGKDAYVVSTLAVWHALCKVRSRCIITSASFTQLESQTESYIRSLCFAINDHFGEKIFLVKKEYIVCTWTGSEIKMFVTDDPGRAEGYHPFPDNKQSEVMIIVNEGKTVPDEIFQAFQRCTYNRFIIVSSPGKTSGYMFNNYKHSRQWEEGYKPDAWYARKVTAYECKHIARSRIDDEKKRFGEHSPWFRSARLAEFTSIDEQVVLTQDNIQKCLTFRSGLKDDGTVDESQHLPLDGLRAGLDLAGGGDENTLYVFHGNKYIGREAFKASDTSVTVNLLIEFFTKYGFTKSTAHRIYADHGGMGESFSGHFRDKGWELSWIMNQSRPRLGGALYANRGAELWFNFKKLIEDCLIILPRDDEKLVDQLTSRYYTQHKTLGKIVLEAKREAKAKGHGSPDRADACVLAFAGTDVLEFEQIATKKLPARSAVTQKRLVAVMPQEDEKWSVFDFVPKIQQSRGLTSTIRRLCHGKSSRD